MLKKKKEMLKKKKSTTVLRKALFSLYTANILKLFNVNHEKFNKISTVN